MAESRPHGLDRNTFGDMCSWAGFKELCHSLCNLGGGKSCILSSAKEKGPSGAPGQNDLEPCYSHLSSWSKSISWGPLEMQTLRPYPQPPESDSASP